MQHISNWRFNSYSGFCKKEYGTKIYKIPINAGFSCPNRDGKISNKGCIYCNNLAFNPKYCNPNLSITKQIDDGISFFKSRYKNANKFVAYFQAFTNSYGDLESLNKIYSQALNHPQISGISIGTRPDCIDENKLNLIKSICKNKIATIEYGIESCYDKTLDFINRGHDFKKSSEAILLTNEYKIDICIHLIFGFPTETRQEMLNQATIVSKLPIKFLKLHQLQIVKNTELEKIYTNNENLFNLFSSSDYIEFITNFLENLNPSIIIERFSSEIPLDMLIAPKWQKLKNDQVKKLIEKNLETRNTYQGRLFKN